MTAENTHKHTITYYLDGQPKETTKESLTVEEILRAGSESPETHFLVEVDEGGNVKHEYIDPSQHIIVHDQQRFASHPKTITYRLDNEPITTTERELTVEQILRSGNLDPSTHYIVELDGHGQEKEEFKDLQHVIKIHNNERFKSVYTGLTPVS